MTIFTIHSKCHVLRGRTIDYHCYCALLSLLLNSCLQLHPTLSVSTGGRESSSNSHYSLLTLFSAIKRTQNILHYFLVIFLFPQMLAMRIYFWNYYTSVLLLSLLSTEMSPVTLTVGFVGILVARLPPWRVSPFKEMQLLSSWGPQCLEPNHTQNKASESKRHPQHRQKASTPNLLSCPWCISS